MREHLRWKLAVAIVTLLPCASCNVVDPVDSSVNNDAHPPRVETLDIKEISPGQHLAGSFDIYVALDTAVSVDNVEWVELIVDDSVVATDHNSPFILRLTTTDFPEGEYVVSVCLRERAHSIGLLGQADVPTIIYSSPVIFDQTPPTPVVLDSVIWEDQSPRLYWQANDDDNFYAYVIDRSSNFGGPQSINEDSIFERTTNTIIDTTIPALYGINLDYEVSVTNRAEEISSNAVNLRFGDTLAMNSSLLWYWLEPKLNPVHDLLYAMRHDYGGKGYITSFSTTDNSYVAEASVYGYREGMAVSKDGNKLFALERDSIIVFDDLSMEVRRAFHLPLWGYDSNSRIAAGRDDRLYVSTSLGSGPDSGSVRIIDAYSGDLEGETAMEVECGWLLTTSDNNTLYVADASYGGGSPAAIYKLDISTDSATITAAQILTDQSIQAWQLSPDEDLLYVLHADDYVDVRDAATLQAVSQIHLPNPVSDYKVLDFCVTSSCIYQAVASNIPGELYFSSGYVYKSDLSDLSVQQSWGFVRVPSFVITPSAEEYLYAFSLQPSVITLR